jgi:hypothetical protein
MIYVEQVLVPGDVVTLDNLGSRKGRRATWCKGAGLGWE